MKPEPERTERVQKLPYRRPVLVCYGDLLSLTRASSGNCTDNANGNQHAPTTQHPICSIV